MKVCVVVPYDLAEQGGVKRHALQLATALRDLGDEVTVMGASSTASFDPEIQVFGGILNIKSNGSDNRLALLTPPWRIQRWLQGQAFDVIHVHEPLCPLLAPWAALFAGDAALVATFHAFAEREATAPRLMRWLSKPLLERYDRAIAVSRPAAQYARFVWKRDLAIIPNGVPTEVFRATPQATRVDEPVRLLFVGHWRDSRKGLPVLLDAVATLRDRGVAVVLDVVGSGPSGEEPPVIPGVRFLGAMASEEAIAEQLAGCDVLVAPSTGQESFGIVLLEAMASARAIVCSSIDGYREVVGPANARLVEPGSGDALAAGIEELVGSPSLRREMGDANRVRAQAYAWPHLADEIRREYMLAVARRLDRVAS